MFCGRTMRLTLLIFFYDKISLVGGAAFKPRLSSSAGAVAGSGCNSEINFSRCIIIPYQEREQATHLTGRVRIALALSNALRRQKPHCV